MASDPTFLTNPDDDLKARRLEALRAPEDPQRAKDAELAEMLGQPAGVSTAPAASAPRAHAAASASDGAEEHWNLVMKKLAPAGYKQSPDWQKQIIDRVVKKLAKKEKEGVKKSKSSYTVDLAAIGLSAEAAAALAQDEARVTATVRSLPAPDRMGRSAPDLASVAKKTKSAAEELVAEQNNKVFHYQRAIQMEELVQQDLESDIKAMSDEVDSAVHVSGGGVAQATWQREKVNRQVATITNRIDALNVKGSEVAAENSNTRILIDDLRKEKLQHAAALDRRCAPPAAPLADAPLSPLPLDSPSPRPTQARQDSEDARRHLLPHAGPADPAFDPASTSGESSRARRVACRRIPSLLQRRRRLVAIARARL